VKTIGESVKPTAEEGREGVKGLQKNASETLDENIKHTGKDNNCENQMGSNVNKTVISPEQSADPEPEMQEVDLEPIGIMTREESEKKRRKGRKCLVMIATIFFLFRSLHHRS
jgi:hypothetical protein